MRLIVTRPEPDASRTARALIRLGHVAILSPMLDVVGDSRVSIADRPFQAVLATSANAVRALSSRKERSRLASRPLLTVGDGTALEAMRLGFAAARSAGGALDDLIAFAAAALRPDAGPLLYAAGDVRTGDLAGRLAGLGFEVETAILYRTEPRPRLSGVAAEALTAGDADGVLFYSRRTALAFVDALRAAGLDPLAAPVACFCLSATVAQPLGAVAEGPVLIAERPDQLSLFSLIERAAASPAAAP